MKSIRKLILICFIFGPLNVTGQTIEQNIDSLLSYYDSNRMFSGTVLVAEMGNILYKNSFGFSNIDTKEKINLNTPICIGSISKQFTAMAVMMLKEKGKLSYEDKLMEYFPDIPGSKDITIRQLLNHTSGTIRYVGLPELRESGKVKTGITNQDIYEVIVHRDSLAFEPGTKYGYSNCGYIFLVMIVEKVSGRLFHEYLAENIFIPLDMKETFLWNKFSNPDLYRAFGYNNYGEKYDYDVFVAGAGGIYSTVGDLYKWNNALYTEKLVSQKTLMEAFEPGLLKNGESSRVLSDSTWGYGFGWLLRKNSTENIVWHDGGYNGFNALFYRELNKKLCLIILSNKGGDQGIFAPVYTIQEGILNIIQNNNFTLPKVEISLKMKDMIESEGIESAIASYYKIQKESGSRYDFSAKQLNKLGYYYLNKKKYKEAIAVFTLYTNVYQDDANAYDSLGEAYMIKGQKKLAIRNYKKSLSLNPGNTNALQKLKELNNQKRKYKM